MKMSSLQKKFNKFVPKFKFEKPFKDEHLSLFGKVESSYNINHRCQSH